ncbi:hypothetical protein QOZ95_000741 [Paenibacillus brasilensis]|uniref:Uncharacterized protein n=1 Tax=Paenibacillus brasilensis TaxID=128574 RepID=A0ABU0KT22_9BACL|nr:hypothetical protein [Paenibacillus brasilensis]
MVGMRAGCGEEKNGYEFPVCYNGMYSIYAHGRADSAELSKQAFLGTSNMNRTV